MRAIVSVLKRTYGSVEINDPRLDDPSLTQRQKKKIAQEAARELIKESPESVKWNGEEQAVDFGYFPID